MTDEAVSALAGWCRLPTPEVEAALARLATGYQALAADLFDDDPDLRIER
jgi:hypothetical protein